MKPFDLSKHLPLIAILRGIEPNDIIRIATLLKEQGFTMIEVPLNSPDALESIRRLVEYFDLNEMMVGAGTGNNRRASSRCGCNWCEFNGYAEYECRCN
ncbi:hypothetical protein [Vibrio algivorus]|uniref:hypothetical protein n=1 Tax=Vibrio algivorus TaxID=1667024 RepID=UPI00232AECFF|nr:hypothetical protein [Vibrio algivorus]